MFSDKSSPVREILLVSWRANFALLRSRFYVMDLKTKLKSEIWKQYVFCFQISDFSFVLEASIFEKILLFIYINIFIYINNEKLRITQPSKIKLKTEIWKQSIVSLPELGLIWFDNISLFTRLSLTFHQMNVDLLSWSGLLLSWKSLLCTDKVYLLW